MPKEEYGKAKLADKILDETTVYEDMAVYEDSVDNVNIDVLMEEQKFGDGNYLMMVKDFSEECFAQKELKSNE